MWSKAIWWWRIARKCLQEIWTSNDNVYIAVFVDNRNLISLMSSPSTSPITSNPHPPRHHPLPLTSHSHPIPLTSHPSRPSSPVSAVSFPRSLFKTWLDMQRITSNSRKWCGRHGLKSQGMSRSLRLGKRAVELVWNFGEWAEIYGLVRERSRWFETSGSEHEFTAW